MPPNEMQRSPPIDEAALAVIAASVAVLAGVGDMQLAPRNGRTSSPASSASPGAMQPRLIGFLPLALSAISLRFLS
jgi:hypothetical protein